MGGPARNAVTERWKQSTGGYLVLGAWCMVVQTIESIGSVHFGTFPGGKPKLILTAEYSASTPPSSLRIVSGGSISGS